MSYTVSYQFGASAGVGLPVAGDHRLRLTMTFTVNATGSNISRFCRDYGLTVLSWGSVNIKREVGDSILAVGQYDFSVHDAEDYLYNLLYDANSSTVEKKALVTLEIMHSGDAAYSNEYVGNLVTPIEYDPDTKVFNFSAMPRTDKLKALKLHNRDSQSIGFNPLGYTTQVINGKKNKFIDIYTDQKLLKDVLHDCFKKVNPNCTLQIKHDWIFESTQNAAQYKFENLYVGYVNNTDNNWLSQLFGTGCTFYNVDSLDDLVKKIAFAFHAVVGMLDNETVIFKELLNYDANNTQTLGKVKSFKKSYKADPIEAVRITSRRYAKNPDNAYGYDEKEARQEVYPSSSDLRLSENVIDEEIIFWQDNQIYWSDVFIKSSGTPYAVKRVYKTDRQDTANLALPRFLMWTLYLFRMQTGETKVDTFTVQGIDYDFMKDFSYSGRGYQILSLTKYYDKNESEIEAVDCAVTDTSFTNDSDEAPRFRYSNILPSGYYKDYTFVKDINATEVNEGSVDIINIEANQQLYSIMVITDKTTALDETVTAMSITDNDGTLITKDELIWLTPNQRVETFIFKNYTEQQTITAHFTGSTTQGRLNVICKILAKG